MPHQRKPPRLWLRPASGRRRAVWLILDAGRQVSTGCSADDLAGARQALARYLAETRAEGAQAIRRRDPADVPLGDVLVMYWQARGASVANPNDLRGCLRRLADWWGAMSADDVTPETCARYVRESSAVQTARRDLQYLSAALGLAYNNAMLRVRVPVTLPPAGRPRDRWLTRSEAARLLWEARRNKYVARYILVGLYSGTRSSAILGARMHPSTDSGWVDLDRGVWHRSGREERETNKRRPPQRLHPRLLAHMRRWKRLKLSRRHLIEKPTGDPPRRVQYGFEIARDRAGLGKDVTPHTLRHTAATWLMLGGCPIWEAAGYLGMAAKTLERVYGHHRPDHQRAAHEAINRWHNR